MSGSITLYIAEKPSMARDLAQVLGARKREGERWVGQSVWVTWCVGHLLEIASPDEHDPRWKSWRPEVLPVLPDPIQWRAKKTTRKHLNTLKSMLRSSDVYRVINACDAGREGELIFRTVYAEAGCRKPVQRFWVSSLTHEAISAGIANLQPSHRFDALSAAAYCRAEADWLVGMNATRALTARANGLLSIGRVQTPTLALMVKRAEEIETFIPEDYWVIEGELEAQTGETWTAHWSRRIRSSSEVPAHDPEEITEQMPSLDQGAGRLKTREIAEQILKKCQDVIGHVSLAEGEIKRTPPPQLFHLTALQQEANRRFGYTAEKTLSIAQSLYERHKLISYPRTDSRCLTPDVARTLTGIIESLPPPWSQFAAPLIERGLPPLGSRYVNAQKVTDHHAIIPTNHRGRVDQLDASERSIYDLIVRSLLAAMYPHAVDQHATLEATIAHEVWRARGRVECEAGWRHVAPPPIKKSSDNLLPFVPVGTPTRLKTLQIQDRQTQPPKSYTDATILGAMERAGRHVDDESLRAILKESGLGTPATRASILNTLIRREYVTREGKLLQPTQAGRALIQSVTEPALLVPELTAEWEKRLQKIANGDEDPRLFTLAIREWVHELTQRLLSGPRVHVPQAEKVKRGTSKRSKALKGKAVQSSTPLATSGKSSEDQQESSWRTRAHHPTQSARSTPKKRQTVTPPVASSRGQTQVRPSAAQLEDVVGLSCPRCTLGSMIRGQRGWGCDRWREGCRFVIWFEFEGVALPAAEAARLCARGVTRLFHQVDGIKWRLRRTEGGLSWEKSSPPARGSSQKKGKRSGQR